MGVVYFIKLVLHGVHEETVYLRNPELVELKGTFDTEEITRQVDEAAHYADSETASFVMRCLSMSGWDNLRGIPAGVVVSELILECLNTTPPVDLMRDYLGQHEHVAYYTGVLCHGYPEQLW